MCPCETIPLSEPCTPCSPISAVSPCLNGEQCLEVIDAGCVEYSNEPLANIGVVTGDRLNTILTKLNINHTSTGIATENTQSVSFQGVGLAGNKLNANVRIDSVVSNNLLTTSTDGLKVVFTNANVLLLLNMIENDAVLQAKFCALMTNCGAQSCGVPTNLVAAMV